MAKLVLKKKKAQTKVKKEVRLGISEELEIVDIDSVIPWEDNPRDNEKAIGNLAKTIQHYGQRTPISVWEKDRKVYKGNTTWYAMKQAGFKKIAVMWQDFENKQEAIGYATSDNKASEWSSWDENKLAELLQSNQFSGMKSADISALTGFNDHELKGLLLTTTELPDVLPNVDLTGNVPDKADFIVIQFENRDEMQEFKKRLGFETKHPRVVPYPDLLSVMDWKEGQRVQKMQKKKLILKKR